MLEEVISLVFLGYFTYTDLRTREIPDPLAYAFLLISIAFFFLHPRPENLVLGLFVAMAMRLTGAWALGDFFVFLSLSLITPYPFAPLYILVFSIVSTIPYLVFRGWRSGALSLRALDYLEVLGFLSAAWFSPLFAVPLFLLSFFRPEVSLLGLVFLFHDPLTPLLSSIPAFLLLAFLKMLWKMKGELYVEKPVEELEEGDIPAEKVYYKGRLVADPRRADGLTKEEIEILRKVRKTIKVKEATPFIVYFLLGYALYLLCLFPMHSYCSPLFSWYSPR